MRRPQVGLVEFTKATKSALAEIGVRKHMLPKAGLVLTGSKAMDDLKIPSTIAELAGPLADYTVDATEKVIFKRVLAVGGGDEL